MYYGIVAAAVVLFGLQFLCNQQYERQSGSGAAASMNLILLSSLIGALALLLMNRFRLETTAFTLMMASVTALNGIACTVCSLKALGRINLSLYSLFSMLGGMVLPFAAGILFYEEELTLQKGICLLLVIGALLFGVEWKQKIGGGLYYLGIFIFNGMSGVLSKIYQAAEYAKTDDTSYSIWSALLSVLIAAVIRLFFCKQKPVQNGHSLLFAGGSGILNRIANLFLLIALSRLPASVQYPMVTGGVIIVSTLLSFFSAQKPGKRELAAVAVSFVGILILII